MNEGEENYNEFYGDDDEIFNNGGGDNNAYMYGSELNPDFSTDTPYIM